jgi:hypothetical protein
MAMTLKELNKHKTAIELDLYKMENEYRTANTNYILHLLLCVPDNGFVLIVWFFISQSRSSRKAKLENLIDESKQIIIEIDSKLIPEAMNSESGHNKKDTKECPWFA